jgi:hypothetical protein
VLLRQITAYQQAVRLAKLGAEQERRWGGIRLQAERKVGELLPPEQPGRRSDLEPLVADQRLSQADYDARKKARKVAAVPEDKFTEYVATADAPTRAGLLRTPEKSSHVVIFGAEVALTEWQPSAQQLLEQSFDAQGTKRQNNARRGLDTRLYCICNAWDSWAGDQLQNATATVTADYIAGWRKRIRAELRKETRALQELEGRLKVIEKAKRKAEQATNADDVA